VYNYTEQPGKRADVTVAVLKPVLSEQGKRAVESLHLADVTWSLHGQGREWAVEPLHLADVQPFDEFAIGFQQNLNELLVTKGMNIRGPFKDIAEMTFPDKQGSDLAIQPEMNFILRVTPVHSSPGMTSVTYTYAVAIGGGLLLNLIEPLSREKMWLVNVEFPTVSKEISVVWKDGQKGRGFVGNAFENAIGELLQNFFDQAMPQVSKYLNVDEMLRVKKLSQELREKKRY
jgi:hypothetical protein